MGMRTARIRIATYIPSLEDPRGPLELELVLFYACYEANHDVAEAYRLSFGNFVSKSLHAASWTIKQFIFHQVSHLIDYNLALRIKILLGETAFLVLDKVKVLCK